MRWLVLALGLIFTDVASAQRLLLSADTTFYFGLAGNDGNSCLSSSSPCRHIQAAFNKAAAYDINFHAVTLQEVGSGVRTYSDAQDCLLAVGPLVGARRINILGDATPSNVVVSCASADGFYFEQLADVYVAGFKITSGATAIDVEFSNVLVGVMEFGPAAFDHVKGVTSSIIFISPYTVSGGAANNHIHSIQFSQVDASVAVTCVGSPSFTRWYGGANAYARFGTGASFSGCSGVTGAQYLNHYNGVLALSSATAPSGFTVLPGSGTDNTGGNRDDHLGN